MSCLEPEWSKAAFNKLDPDQKLNYFKTSGIFALKRSKRGMETFFT